MQFPFGNLPSNNFPSIVEDLGAPAAVCHAQVRQGSAEHEWLSPERSDGLRYQCRTARMTVARDRASAASDGEVIELDLVVARAQECATLDILCRLPADSWILVTDASDRQLMPPSVEDREHRVRIALPEGAVRISAKLGDGARLSVRVGPAGR